MNPQISARQQSSLPAPGRPPTVTAERPADAAFALDPEHPQGLPSWLRQLHRRHGRPAMDWLRFVRRNPEAMQRSSFSFVDWKEDNWLYYTHPWPFFLTPATQRRLEEATTAVSNLIQSLPTRLFGDDPQRLARALHLDLEEATIAADHRGRRDSPPLWTRADFYDTPQGLRCLELNASSFLGGWQDATWRSLYEQHPIVRQFLQEYGLRVQPGGQSLDHLFCGAARRAWDAGFGADGELNLLLTLRSQEQLTEVIRFDDRDAVGQLWTAALNKLDPNLRGRVTLGLLEDLDLDHRTPRFEQAPQHIVVEFYVGMTPEPLRRCIDGGGVHVYNGPSHLLLRSKLHLALLHEHLESDAFSEGERRQIRAHVPWSARTRRDRPLRFRGEVIEAEKLLLSHRDDLVLKLGHSASGEGVHVGFHTPPEEWEQRVATALDEPGWMVQERVDGLPLLLQGGERGACLHDVAWGLFTFGDDYGGGFLRVRPSDPEGAQRAGVVNVSQGALESALLVVD
ncbi:MAG: hypothetical protein AAGD01_14000 [Acidobacteriota bacterium]